MSFSRIFMFSYFFFFLCLRLVLGDYASDVDRKYENLQTNVLLVLDIQKFVESRTVFIVYSDKDENMRMTSIMSSLLRKFSDKNVFSMTMNYTDMPLFEEHYRHRIGRPLYIVFLHTMQQVERFERVTRNYHVSYPLWLVIFSRDLTRVCDRPRINYFHVRFDTMMMVKCDEDPTIREWYSIDGKGMRYSNLVYWNHTKMNYSERMRLTAREGTYNRRYNLEGSVLRVATVKDSSFILKDKGQYQGYFAAILRELTKVLNFNASLDYEEVAYGSRDKRTGRYNGVIGRLQSGEVDLGVAELTMTAPRLDVVDFTMPILVSKNYLYIRRPGKSYLLWSAYFKVYTLFSWLALQGTFYLSIVTVTVIQLVLKEKPASANYISDNWISIWGIYCQQGLPVFPTSAPARIAYLSILASSLILLSVYAACLVSYLTHTPPIVLFNSFAEFARDGSYQLMASFNSSDYDLFMESNDSLMIDMSKLMRKPQYLPKTMIAGFEQVCANRVAFYATEVVKNSVTARILCDLATVTSGTVGSLGITLTKDNQYQGLINTCLMRFRDHGILSKLRSDVYRKMDDPKNNFVPVTLNGVAVLLIILGVGMALSLVVLFVEIAVYRRNYGRLNRKHLPMYADNAVVTKNDRIYVNRY